MQNKSQMLTWATILFAGGGIFVASWDELVSAEGMTDSQNRVMKTNSLQIAKASSESEASTSGQVHQTTQKDKRSDESLSLLKTYLSDSSQICNDRPQYQAQLEKHVSVDGRLQDPEEIEVKVRENPFCVYMKWKDDGQQVLYVDGENDNQLIAKPTNALAAIRSIWKLDPDSRHAMKGNRYPITEVGIGRLADRISRVYSQPDIHNGVTCSHREEVMNGRPVIVFHVNFHSPEIHSEYSNSRILFDSVGKWIVGVENHGWTETGSPGELVEKYIYHQIDFNARIDDSDFSLNNPQYRFTHN